MNALTVFIIEIIISLSMSVVTLWVLNKPLKNILLDLCPTQTQADFWVAYTRIMLSAAPLLLVLMFTNTSKHILMNPNAAILVVKSSIIAALIGLLFGLLIVGRKVFTPVSTGCINQ